MIAPQLRLEAGGGTFRLGETVTTIGRGAGVDVSLDDPSVSRLHAEIVRQGAHVYVADVGLSTNGTRVNGRRVQRQVLVEGDVLTFGTVRARIAGVGPSAPSGDTTSLRISTPYLTRRELEVLQSLCGPLLQGAEAAPRSTAEIAGELGASEAAVKQHLHRLYRKFRVEEGTDRVVRLAEEVLGSGVLRPSPDSAL